VLHFAVDAGLRHGRRLVTELRHEALAPGAGLFILIPVEGRRDYEALGRLQAERMDVGDEDQETGQPLFGDGSTASGRA